MCTIANTSFFPFKVNSSRQICRIFTYFFGNCSDDYAVLTTKSVVKLFIILHLPATQYYQHIIAILIEAEICPLVSDIIAIILKYNGKDCKILS